MSDLFPIEALPAEMPDVTLTLDEEIALFLNRWCHRALGDRADAERELRALIEMAKAA